MNAPSKTANALRLLMLSTYVVGCQSAQAAPATNEGERLVSRGAPLHFQRSADSLQQAIRQGEHKLIERDTHAAQEAFMRALALAPEDSEIMLSLAATAFHRGRTNEARTWVQKAMATTPFAHQVQASYLTFGAATGADELSTESRIKNALENHPESAHLHFALGNIKSTGGNWVAAKQAYQKASAIDPGHPDYLFNLAVSLEHCRQPAAARAAYREALKLAEFRPAFFPLEHARERIVGLAERE